MAATVTLIAHYKPRPSEGEEFKLKLKVPGTKTVNAVVKAFAKAVAKSPRGYGLVLDATECFVNLPDGTYVRPETLAGDLGAPEIRIVRRDDVPETRADDTDWARAKPTAHWIANCKDDGGI